MKSNTLSIEIQKAEEVKEEDEKSCWKSKKMNVGLRAGWKLWKGEETMSTKLSENAKR